LKAITSLPAVVVVTTPKATCGAPPRPRWRHSTPHEVHAVALGLERERNFATVFFRDDRPLPPRSTTPPPDRLAPCHQSAAAVAMVTVVINERRFMLDLADRRGWNRSTSRRCPAPPDPHLVRRWPGLPPVAGLLPVRPTRVHGVGRQRYRSTWLAPLRRAAKLGDHRSIDLGKHRFTPRSPVGVVVPDPRIEAGLARVICRRT